MAELFISYSKQDPQPARDVADYLKSKGYSVWWDTNLTSGEIFREVIDRELDAADAVIVIWTVNSVTSKWVLAEADHADRAKKLITLRTNDLEIWRIPKPYNTYHTDTVDNREAILAAVRRVIGRIVSAKEAQAQRHDKRQTEGRVETSGSSNLRSVHLKSWPLGWHLLGGGFAFGVFLAATIWLASWHRESTPPAPTEVQPTSGDDRATGVVAFQWPAIGRIINNFGAKVNGSSNDGIDLAVPEGTQVRAAADGVVAYAGNELKGYGNVVLVRHSSGFVTVYANASELFVKRNDQVHKGQVILKSGQTGNAATPQLHFEIRINSAPVDPTRFLPSFERVLRDPKYPAENAAVPKP